MTHSTKTYKKGEILWDLFTKRGEIWSRSAVESPDFGNYSKQKEKRAKFQNP